MSRFRRQLAAAALGWSAAAAIGSLLVAAYARSLGERAAWREVVLPTLLFCAAWALVTPCVQWLARRVPPERGRLALAVGVRALAAAGGAFVQLNLFAAALVFLPGVEAADRYSGFFLERVYENVAIGVALVAADTLYERSRRAHQEALRRARLEASLAEARLHALAVELHPHFLFNTLNGIAGMIHTDPRAADRMIVQLSELLRETLALGREQRVPLAREAALLGLYLDLQRARFGDRLAVHLAIPDSLGDALVPQLILQPLVENALEHGVARRRGPANVWVAAAAEDGRLRLTVRDDGAGLPAERADGTGLGNTRRRLAGLFPGRHALTLAPAPGQGTEVRIAIPLERGAPCA